MRPRQEQLLQLLRDHGSLAPAELWAALAAELLASLDGPPDADAHEAWDAEIGRRISAIESGHMQLESWDEVKQRVAKDVLGR